MATEIERKFLLKNDLWRELADDGVVIRQGYLLDPSQSANPKSSVRIRISGDSANINIKSATLGITRQEYEYDIAMSDADEILNSLAEGPLVEKTRYHVTHGAHIWEIDVFAGENLGLEVAEIELSDADETFKKPQS